MKNIGLIFDMDGVIVHNNEYHYKAWQQLAANHDIEINRNFYRENMNGRTLSELMEVLFGDSMEKSKALEIGRKKEAIYRELYQNEREPTSGLLNFLNEAQDRGIPMVVGTSAPIENVEFILNGLDLRKYFKGVVNDTMVTKGKPHPEVYIKCAEMIGLKNEACIVFEDALSGIEAGKRAGSKVIALATSHQRDELDADLIIADFNELEWEQIMVLLGK